MSGNKNIGLLIITAGVLVAFAMSFFGKNNNTLTPSVNPDPINHPNARLVNGVWRDDTYFFNPNTRIWSLINSGTNTTQQPGIVATSFVFDTIMPEMYLPAMSKVKNYNNVLLISRDPAAEGIMLADTVELQHPDYANKKGSVIIKQKRSTDYLFVITVPWNLISFNNTKTTLGQPVNYAAGRVVKTY